MAEPVRNSRRRTDAILHRRTVPAIIRPGAILVLFLSLAAGAAVSGQQSRRRWPAPVQPASSSSRPLSPSDALDTFALPPGYRIELVAAEPLIQDPVAIDFDPDGRIWTVEMPGYMRDVAARDEHAAVGRVVVLEDADGDGRMDRRTVFADGLVMARAVRVLERGVLVGEPPNLWLMRDTDGDRRADAKVLVTSEFGRREGDPQNNANGLFWALDNRIHLAGQADITLRPTATGFDVQKSLRRGQWGVTQDDAGRVFRNTNESALHVDLVPSVYFARNPNLLRARGSYERLADDNPNLNVVWPAHATPALNRGYQLGIRREDGTLARFTAVCSPLVYRGDRLPEEIRGSVFVAEPAANLVSRIVVDDEAGVLRARKAYDAAEFLTSTDERFRPVFLSNAPDGTLYIVDMYRGVLEHRLSLTEYLRNQILARGLEQPTGMGRLYRVVHEAAPRDTSNGFGGATLQTLAATLAHANGWRRDTAQRLLVERMTAAPDAATARGLARLAVDAPDWRTRLHALWTLDGARAIEPGLVERLLGDSSAAVRAAALRVSEQWLNADDHPLRAAVMARVNDSDAGVRRQLAASIGDFAGSAREAAAAAMLDAHGDDPVVVDAVLSGLRGVESTVLSRVLALPAETPQRTAAAAMLAGTIVRSAEDGAVQPLLAAIADGSKPQWQRSALLLGAEIALLGTRMPGTPEPRPARANQATPCPTCPGARGGPGGAYAYARPPVPAAPALLRLRLNREPEALSALTGDLAPRAAAVLARMSWPGKRGEPVEVPMLTAAEERRFAAGRDVYRNVCQACHQPDGRGQARIAPSLVGSVLTLGPAELPVRVLLHGKEGAVGLMPPVGATLTDDQIASVLTYVRREWGQAVAPVAAETVAGVRRQTAGRSRPWTDAELQNLRR